MDIGQARGPTSEKQLHIPKHCAGSSGIKHTTTTDQLAHQSQWRQQSQVSNLMVAGMVAGICSDRPDEILRCYSARPPAGSGAKIFQ